MLDFNLANCGKSVFMKAATAELSMSWQAFAVLSLSLVIITLPDFAFATNDDISLTICNAAAMFTGNAGRGLATIGISILGVGALLGKVSWGLAMIVGIGIAILFGAENIIMGMGLGAGSFSGCPPPTE